MALRSTTAREQQQILGQESNARYSKGLPMLLLLLLLMRWLLLLSGKQTARHWPIRKYVARVVKH